MRRSWACAGPLADRQLNIVYRDLCSLPSRRFYSRPLMTTEQKRDTLDIDQVHHHRHYRTCRAHVQSLYFLSLPQLNPVLCNRDFCLFFFRQLVHAFVFIGVYRRAVNTAHMVTALLMESHLTRYPALPPLYLLFVGHCEALYIFIIVDLHKLRPCFVECVVRFELRTDRTSLSADLLCFF